MAILIGVGAAFGFNPVVGGLVTSGLALAGGLIYPPLKNRRLKALYRQKESQNLIEP